MKNQFKNGGNKKLYHRLFKAEVEAGNASVKSDWTKTEWNITIKDI